MTAVLACAARSWSPTPSSDATRSSNVIIEPDAIIEPTQRDAIEPVLQRDAIIEPDATSDATSNQPDVIIEPDAFLESSSSDPRRPPDAVHRRGHQRTDAIMERDAIIEAGATRSSNPSNDPDAIIEPDAIDPLIIEPDPTRRDRTGPPTGGAIIALARRHRRTPRRHRTNPTRSSSPIRAEPSGRTWTNTIVRRDAIIERHHRARRDHRTRRDHRILLNPTP